MNEHPGKGWRGTSVRLPAIPSIKRRGIMRSGTVKQGNSPLFDTMNVLRRTLSRYPGFRDVRRWLGIGLCAMAGLMLSACRSPTGHREKADRTATRIVEQREQELFGRETAFSIERPVDTLRRRLLREQDLPSAGVEALGTDRLTPIPHWPEADYPRAGEDPPPADSAKTDFAPFSLDLTAALEVGAANSREYQDRKEDIYRAALSLDLETFQFRNTYLGTFDSTYTDDRSGEEGDTRGIVNTATLGVSRTLQTGAALSSRIMFDLVKLLTLDKESAYGVMADLSVTVPLLRGAGRHVVTEPLTQAERNVIYSMYTFENFKRRYAVRVASEYLQVLQQLDQVRNAEDNYERVAVSARRARRLADAGRLPEIQVDQAQQEELRARDRWLSAVSTYERRLDQLKITLGLPADAQVELDGADLGRLTDEMEAWVLEQQEALLEIEKEGRDETSLSEQIQREERISSEAAIRLAFEHRLDMSIARGRVFDAQRAVTVAADRLRLSANLTGSAQAGSRRGLGSAGMGDARFDPGEGIYSAGLAVDVPWSRTEQRNAYRDSFIALERATRSVQDLEDQVKSEVRNALRVLIQARESMAIQARSVELAQRRVDSTELFLQAGRAQIRDVLEAQEALVSARDALTSAVVTYRLAELELQRDMGVLEVDEHGLWTEYAEWNE